MSGILALAVLPLGMRTAFSSLPDGACHLPFTHLRDQVFSVCQSGLE